jgi:hypothetical protein
VSGSDAQYTGALTAKDTSNNTTSSLSYIFYFVKEGGSWKFDGFGKTS